MMKLCSILLCEWLSTAYKNADDHHLVSLAYELLLLFSSSAGALAFGLATASSKQGAGPSSAAAGQQQQAAKPSISTSSNPLVPNGLFPQWDKIKPESIEPAVKQVLQEEGAALDLLEADLEAAGKDITYERIYRPYAQIRYRLDSTYGLLDHLEVS